MAKVKMRDQWATLDSMIDERMLLIAQEGFVEVGSDVIVRSPVDEGTFRNNWFSSINTPSTKTTTSKSKKGFGSKGGARFTELLHTSTAAEIGDTMYLMNSLPYANALDNGHSTMAPGGMVRIATAQWPLVIDRLARKFK